MAVTPSAQLRRFNMDIKLIVLLIVFVVSNYLTYTYVNTSWKQKQAEQNNAQFVRKLDNSTKELEKAKVITQKITEVVTIYAKEKEILERETNKLPNTCELSSDGLRVIQDAIDRSNRTSNPD